MISGGSKAKCTWRDPLAVTRGCSLRNSRWSFTKGEISMCKIVSRFAHYAAAEFGAREPLRQISSRINRETHA